MQKYLLPVFCIIFSGCASRSNTAPYYDVPPPQPTAFYSYAHPIQQPSVQTSLRHPIIKTTTAPKKLTPAKP
jgi:hypothetical protein